ncbi:MAG: hypothetical protein JNL67_18925 [Planctomycetaceae bacterium]|nr:hypothetical protein [Planctomycetaceae bacterium]
MRANLPPVIGWSWSYLALFLLSFTVALPVSGQEEDELPTRPACNRILPEETVLYFRIRSIPEMVELARQNGLDQMAEDERLSALWGDLYKEVQTEYDAQVKGELDDLELEQFQDLFAGEMCFALVAKRRQPMEGVMILDVKPESETADRLFGVAERRLEEDGRPVETDTEDEIEIKIIRTGEDRDIFYFRQEDTLYFATNRDLCAEMIANLKGKPLEKTRPFFENRKYRTIMGQCRVDKDHPPMATFFIDPIELFKASTRGEPFAAVAVGFFPILGVDGLLGIGGAVLPGDKEFTSISHLHLLMSSPREGLLKAISFRSGDFDIPLSIPEDAGVFMATSFDVPRLYSGIETIYNAFNGEGSFGEIVQRGSEEIGFDIKKDLIDLLTGTVMMVNRSDPESQAFNGASNGYLIELNDPKKFEETLKILLDRIQQEEGGAEGERSEFFSKVNKDGQEYWVADIARERMEDSREFRRQQLEELEDEDERQRRERGLDFEVNFTRSPEPAFGFLENQFVITDSVELMDHLVASLQGKAPSLNESEHYSEVRKKAEFLLGGKQPAGIMYNRPINQLSSLWNAITNKETIDMMKEGVQDEPFLSRLVEAYSRNQLPPLEEMSEYFRTSGAVMTDDATGLHFLMFEMRNKPKE